jgi:hypothetical protein
VDVNFKKSYILVASLVYISGYSYFEGVFAPRVFYNTLLCKVPKKTIWTIFHRLEWV